MRRRGGLAFLSFACWRTVDSSASEDKQRVHMDRRAHWGFVLSDTAKRGWEELPAILPFRPLWPGFIFDTAFYGTLTFLLWSAPGLIRRRSRLRRRACPACGYDLVGMNARCVLSAGLAVHEASTM
jgi:hypothetical protein